MSILKSVGLYTLNEGIVWYVNIDKGLKIFLFKSFSGATAIDDDQLQIFEQAGAGPRHPTMAREQ